MKTAEEPRKPLSIARSVYHQAEDAFHEHPLECHNIIAALIESALIDYAKQERQQGRIEGAKWAAGKAFAQDKGRIIDIGAKYAGNAILSSLDELKEIK